MPQSHRPHSRYSLAGGQFDIRIKVARERRCSSFRYRIVADYSNPSPQLTMHASDKENRKRQPTSAPSASAGSSRNSSSSKSSQLKRIKQRLSLLRSHHQDSLSQRAGDVELALEQIVFEQMMRQAENEQIELRQHSDGQLQKALAQVQSDMSKLLGRTDETAEVIFTGEDLSKRADLIADLETLRAEHENVLELLAEQKAISALIKSPPADSYDLSQAEMVSLAEYEHLQKQVDNLTAELAIFTYRDETDMQNEQSSQLSNAYEQIERLKEQLLQDRQTIVELRMKLDDSAAAMASMPLTQDTMDECLSWDQLKQRLLAQLEDDSLQMQVDTGEAMEIQEIIALTQSEVDRRDKEIAELKSLLAQQSTASNSMAIGAAAVAELLNHDDLIREERENLQMMQAQWKQKMREVEVKVSMERAKLARERTELDERVKETQVQSQHKAEATEKQTGGSRWLARLGLGDERNS